MPESPQPLAPHSFIKMAYKFEGGIGVIAFIFGWIIDIDPLADFYFDGAALSWGILGTIPIFLIFLLSYQYPIGALYQIKRSLIEIMGPMLSHCRWYELLLLALLAGVAEELLFRGVLQPWFESKWGLTAGLFGSNILFGLAHMITPLYAVLAYLIGIYLSLMLDVDSQRNLLTPVVIHGLYDYLAFFVVIHSYRQESC